MSDIQTIGAVAEDRIAVASNWTLVWWRFRRHHLALFSAGLLICMYLVVLCPEFFSTQNPERTDARQAFIPVQPCTSSTTAGTRGCRQSWASAIP